MFYEKANKPQFKAKWFEKMKLIIFMNMILNKAEELNNKKIKMNMRKKSSTFCEPWTIINWMIQRQMDILGTICNIQNKQEIFTN